LHSDSGDCRDRGGHWQTAVSIIVGVIGVVHGEVGWTAMGVNSKRKKKNMARGHKYTNFGNEVAENEESTIRHEDKGTRVYNNKKTGSTSIGVGRNRNKNEWTY
jgi:hypothetical protein